jgi:diacylglycerol kinase family enzyme
MRLTLVHNPSSGAGGHRAEALVAALRSAGHDAACHARGEPGLADAIARPAEAIVLAGGDGTVSKLLHLLVARGLPIGILPLGTANDLARSLGIGGAVEEIAAGWRADSVVRLDVGVARGAWGERLFVDSAGAGAISQAMQAADEEPDRAVHRSEAPPVTEALAQVRAFLRDRVMRARAGGLEILADGRALPADTLLAEAMIIPLLGPRLPIAPGADPSDGMLDLAHAREGDRDALAAWMTAGGEESPPPLRVERVRRVTFRRVSGPLRVGDAFEQSPGTDSVAEIAGTRLSVLVS